MKYRTFFLSLVCVSVMSSGVGLFLSYLVDPVGIWGTSIVRGVNHYKVKQEKYLDVYKPYEYMREKPSILYIGASQILVGFRQEERTYNMGLGALSFPHMREYLRFVYRVHKPDIIYIGIAPQSFQRYGYYMKRRGFSKERLKNLLGNLLDYYRQAWSDEVGIRNCVERTFCSSDSVFDWCFMDKASVRDRFPISRDFD